MGRVQSEVGQAVTVLFTIEANWNAEDHGPKELPTCPCCRFWAKVCAMEAWRADKAILESDGKVMPNPMPPEPTFEEGAAAMADEHSDDCKAIPMWEKEKGDGK